jgi:hypothetical protein
VKKVLLIVVDALSSEIVLDALADGRLPNLRAVGEAGVLRERSCAIFPSITPAATGALATGCGPAEHGIAGAHWIDEEAEAVAYYGDDLWVVLREGLDDFLNDFLVTLNYDRLLVPGIFDRVERAGLTAACINYLWFRGDVEHDVRQPWLLSLIPGVSLERTVRGPTWLQLGDFVFDMPEGIGAPSLEGIRRRYGFNDERTAETLLELARVGLPDFTLAYFPDNDFESHDRGPRDASPVLDRLDETLGRLFESAGGREAFLRDTALIVTGDHAQSNLLPDPDDRGIELADVLDGLALGTPGEFWSEGDEVLACPNLRAALFYVRDRRPDLLETVVERLRAEAKVDQVIVGGPASGSEWFRVHRRPGGGLRFRPAEAGRTARGRDARGRSWEWEGDLSAVDATLEGDVLRFGEFPHAFERIASSFAPASGPVWATARIGYEFRLGGRKIHERGSHGSLHARDSLSPLFVAGHGPVAVPDEPRSIDVAPLCAAILGLG